MGHIERDIRVAAQKAHEEPALGLAAIFAAPGFALEIGREIVGDPVRGLGLDPDESGREARLFLELPQGRVLGRFARVDPALGHLPGGTGGAFALADKLKETAGFASSLPPAAAPGEAVRRLDEFEIVLEEVTGDFGRTARRS